jgi:hypothetical protein
MYVFCNISAVPARFPPPHKKLKHSIPETVDSHFKLASFKLEQPLRLRQVNFNETISRF